MEVLLNDSGTLKKGDVATFLGGGSAENITLKGDVLPCGYGTHTNSYKSITMTANYWYGLLFWVGGEMNVTHIGLQTGVAVAHYIVVCIYKYVYASDSWTKVDQVGNIKLWGANKCNRSLCAIFTKYASWFSWCISKY